MPFREDMMDDIKYVPARKFKFIKLWPIAFLIASLILIYPSYLLGKSVSQLWDNWPDNPKKFVKNNIVIPKTIDIKSPEVSDTQIVPLTNGSNYLYLTVSNKLNPKIGFYPFVYKVQVLNGLGTIISEQRYDNYLLPGESKYIVEQSKNPEASKLKIEVDESATKPILYNLDNPRVFKEPNISVDNNKATKIDGTDKINIGARLKNANRLKIDQVDILYIVRDTRASVVGIGVSSVRNFEPDSTKEFNIEYPLPKDRVFSLVEIIPTVNYLNEDMLTVII